MVADDYFAVLIDVRTVLEREGGTYQIAGEAPNGRNLLRLLGSQRCDLVITDFSMPDSASSMDGLILLNELRTRHPGLPVVVLTMASYPPLIRNMFEHGARGVVNKRGMHTELLECLRAVMGGRNYLSAQLRADTATASTHPPKGDPVAADALEALSVRETEILRLHMQGFTVKEIAGRLHHNVTTISQHMNHAMHKLGLASLDQLQTLAQTYQVSN